jgi:hypothetical protein
MSDIDTAVTQVAAFGAGERRAGTLVPDLSKGARHAAELGCHAGKAAVSSLGLSGASTAAPGTQFNARHLQ